MVVPAPSASVLPPLRPYQAQAVAAVLAAHEPTCLVAPTGSGKTLMGCAIVAQIPGPALWLVHRRELLDQTDRILRGAGLRERCEPATIQGLLASERRPEAALVIGDEAHHLVADLWREIPEAYPTAKLVGLTATPQRSDGRSLGDMFRQLVVAAHYSELVRDGHLVPCRVLRPDEALREANADFGTWRYGLAQDPVAAYLEQGEGRTGYVYVPRIVEAERLAERFREAGIPAEAVSANSGAGRKGALDRLRAGTIRLICNVYTCTEGVDVPSAGVCILARGVGHVAPYLQIVGRILRPAPGKNDALLIDLPGVSHLYGMPTDDRVYSLDGDGISAPTAPSVTVCAYCGATYESGPAECPECGFVRPSKEWVPLRIYNRALEAVYRGAATPIEAQYAEYRRLRALAARNGWSLSWVVREYRALFGDAPNLGDVNHAERMDELRRLRQLGHAKGYKPGFASARYKSLFGAWPPRESRW